MWQNEYYYQSGRPAASGPAPGRSGSGGAHSNITVVGARYGVDARDTQPSASLTNVRLLNQSCAALLHEGPRPGCTPWCAWHGAHGMARMVRVATTMSMRMGGAGAMAPS